MFANMGVSNTTGAHTLFIAVAVLALTVAFLAYRSIVDARDDREGDNQLVRRDACYAVDISMILNAMTSHTDATMRTPDARQEGSIRLYE